MTNRTKQIKISLTDDEHAALVARARSTPPGIIARELVLAGLAAERTEVKYREVFLADDEDPGIL